MAAYTSAWTSASGSVGGNVTAAPISAVGCTELRPIPVSKPHRSDETRTFVERPTHAAITGWCTRAARCSPRAWRASRRSRTLSSELTAVKAKAQCPSPSGDTLAAR
eukprot:1108121-Prymnesium_polylepis.1